MEARDTSDPSQPSPVVKGGSSSLFTDSRPPGIGMGERGPPQTNGFPFFMTSNPPQPSHIPPTGSSMGFGSSPFQRGPMFHNNAPISGNNNGPFMGFPPSNRPIPTDAPRVSDLESQMMQHPGVSPLMPPPHNQNPPFSPFFAGPPPSQQTNEPSGLDQMMARMRIMAQRREQQKKQANQVPFGNSMAGGPMSGFPMQPNMNVNMNMNIPTFSMTQQPSSGMHQKQQQHAPQDFPSLSNPFDVISVSEISQNNAQRKSIVVSEPTADTELFDEPTVVRITQEEEEEQEEKKKKDTGPLILLPAPPPDPNRTGVYITNRTKRILGKLPELNSRKENRINQTIMNLLDDLRPSPEVKEARDDLVSRLQKWISELYPDHNVRLYLFGSSANHFALKKHDVDVCMTIDPSAGTKSEIIERLANAMPDEEAEDINPLVWARVPILKFKDKRSGYQCDICVNNVLALRNTKLLADYAAIDPRVRILVLIVKYWAKRRKINSPYTGTLSSYAYVLMVIQYLQTRSPPVLPCLQQIIPPNTPKVIIQDFDCTYNENIDQFRGFGSRNRDSPAKLLVGFFKLYGFEFDYIHSVICIRTGGFLSKDIKQWMIPSHPRECCFFGLEDPFDTTHNLGRIVDRPGMDTIRNEFERGYKILVKTGDFERATQEYTEENPDTRW